MSGDDDGGRIRFLGKIAFVTGGGAGIGRASTRALAEARAKVDLIWQEKKDLEETCHILTLKGAQALVD